MAHTPTRPVAPNVEDPPCDRCGGDPASCACYEEKHAATPWSLKKNAKGMRIYSANGYMVADAKTCEGLPMIEDDNAAFIVTACNAHYALLTAAKALRDAMKSRSATATEYDALDKAIALAEGGKDSVT